MKDKIKALRKRTGLSQDKFAEKYGINVNTLRAWERGIRKPCPMTFLGVKCKVLGYRIIY